MDELAGLTEDKSRREMAFGIRLPDGTEFFPAEESVYRRFVPADADIETPNGRAMIQDRFDRAATALGLEPQPLVFIQRFRYSYVSAVKEIS